MVCANDTGMTLFEYCLGLLGLARVQAAPANEPRRTPRVDPPPVKRGMKIRPEAVARIGIGEETVVPLRLYTTRERTREDDLAYRAAHPMPNVVPDGTTAMAMDEAPFDPAQFYSGLFASSFTEGMHWLGYPYLAELTQRAEYRRITETMARDMTRRWIKLNASGEEDKSDKIDIIDTQLKKHKIQHKMRQIAELDGFFGRAHMYVDMGIPFDDREQLQVPIILDRRTFKKGSLKGFRVVEPIWTYPGKYNSNNPLALDFYCPTTWYVMSREVHKTRLLTFVARSVPDLLKPSYAFGGLSMSQMAKPYVDNWLRTRQSVSDLLHSFSVMVLSTDMSGGMSDGFGETEDLRAKMFNTFRDNRGLFMIDKNLEDFKNVSTSLGTLDHLQAQSQEHMASVSGIPLVILTGITPSGLNASSEGELQVWAQTVHSMQEHLFGDHLKSVIEMIQLDQFGDIDPDITFEFLPLEEESEADKLANKKAESDTDKNYVDMGALSPDDIRQKLAQDDDSAYAGIDLSGPPPTPPAQEPDPLGGGPGAGPGGGGPPGAGGSGGAGGADPVAAGAAGDTVDEIAKHLATPR